MSYPPFSRILLTGLLIAMFSGILPGQAGDSTDLLPFEAPRFAKVKPLTQAGSWQWEGMVKGNLSAARTDLDAQIKRGGWRLQHVIPMRTAGQKSNSPAGQLLATWEKGDQALLVLLREGAAGHTHFLAGLAPNQNQSSFQNRHRNP